MADIKHIRDEIAAIANRPNGVEFAELVRIVGQLEVLGHAVEMKQGKHSYMLRVGDQRCTGCSHNPRRKHLKSVYVRGFLDMMAALGLFDEE